MLRVELTTQLLRIRTLVVLACLAAVPVMAGLSYASHAGHRTTALATCAAVLVLLRRDPAA
ncbi:hypothetical protein [Streptomyces sp. NPDC057579]|uniref:hypothetical protein n=1 Tax=Streptomyces sp. NPDC057579 TaxID=3346172 RepID=UPI0036920C48